MIELWCPLGWYTGTRTSTFKALQARKRSTCQSRLFARAQPQRRWSSFNAKAARAQALRPLARILVCYSSFKLDAAFDSRQPLRSLHSHWKCPWKRESRYTASTACLSHSYEVAPPNKSCTSSYSCCARSDSRRASRMLDNQFAHRTQHNS